MGLGVAALGVAGILIASEPMVRPTRFASNVSADDPLWPALQKRMTEAGAGVSREFLGWNEINSPALKTLFPDYRFFESPVLVGDIAGSKIGKQVNIAGMGYVWVFTKQGETVSVPFYDGYYRGFQAILGHLLAANKFQVLSEEDARLVSDALFPGDSSSSGNLNVVKSGERRWQLASNLGFYGGEDDERKFITEVVLDDDHRVVTIEDRNEKTGRKVARPGPPPQVVAPQQPEPLLPLWEYVALVILIAGVSTLIFRRRSLSRKTPST